MNLSCPQFSVLTNMYTIAYICLNYDIYCDDSCTIDESYKCYCYCDSYKIYCYGMYNYYYKLLSVLFVAFLFTSCCYCILIIIRNRNNNNNDNNTPPPYKIQNDTK